MCAASGLGAIHTLAAPQGARVPIYKNAFSDWSVRVFPSFIS